MAEQKESRLKGHHVPEPAPEDSGDDLLAAAQAKAPNLTAEYVAGMELSEEQLAQIARGELSPPPVPGPAHTNDIYLTPGGYQITPPGVKPEDVGKDAIAR